MTPRPLTVLVRFHRRALWIRPLAGAAVALGLNGALARFGVETSVRFWCFGFALGLALVSRFWPRQTLRGTACALDARTGSNNRFEAVVEFGDRADPLAAAAQAEAAAYLQQHPLPRAFGWWTAVTSFAASLLLTMWIFHQGARPAKLETAAATPAVVSAPTVALPASPPPPRPLAPKGSSSGVLRWVAPGEEITATAKEEIPLTAEVKTDGGLRALTLHVAVNGERRAPVTIPDEILAGEQTVSLSLFLSSLEVQPYEVVTYSLHAELIRPKELSSEPTSTEVSSPLQLVQIRPLRDEPMGKLDSDDPITVVWEKIQRLKREQFEILRDAFALGQATALRKGADGSDLVRATAARQTAVAEQAAEIITFLSAPAFPAEVASTLTAVKTEALQSAAALARANPAEAVLPATRARSQLAVVEKFLRPLVLAHQAQRAAEALAATPAAKTDAGELPARAGTPAGRLEKMAAEQKAAADQLAARTAAAEMFKEQDRLAREVAKLAGEKALSGEITELVKAAGGSAREAASQLNEQDPLAAREPATRAAQELGDVVASLNRTGRERAAEELLAVQQTLIRAATDLQMAQNEALAPAAKIAAERVNAAQQALRAGAQRQQQQGSADAARKLNELATSLAQSPVKKELADLAQPEPGASPARREEQKSAASQKLMELAQRAADAAAGLDRNEQSAAEIAEELRRIQANLDRIAGRISHPLRWVKPTADIFADAGENVALIAEATSEAGFARVALRVTVNGASRPPVAISVSVAKGRHQVPLSLALEPFKLKAGDIVSYLLTAERVPAGVTSGGPKPEEVTSPLQLIKIQADAKKPNEAADASAGGGSEGEKKALAEKLAEKIAELGTEIRRLQDAQREIVERTFTLERDPRPRVDPSWREAVRSVEMDEAKTESGVVILLNQVGLLAPASFKDARDEMRRAIAEFRRPDLAAAAPPAVRALALLSKFSSNLPPAVATPHPPSDSSAPSKSSQAAETENKENTESKGDKESGPNPPLPGSISGGETSSEETTALYEQAARNLQRLEVTVAPGKMPPPPGSGASIKEIRDFAGQLSDRISGLVRLAAEVQRETKRPQVLTTANPSEAPPAYQPAVADYFEKLARDRAAPAPAPAPRQP